MSIVISILSIWFFVLLMACINTWILVVFNCLIVAFLLACMIFRYVMIIGEYLNEDEIQDSKRS